MEIRSYKDLMVWQKARVLVKAVYDVSSAFPQEERFGLTSQIRRAAVSVPSNIAEGHSRSGTKDYIRFLSMAIGSLAEVETQLLLAMDLNFIDPSDTEKIILHIEEMQKMLHTLRNKLKQSNP